MKRFSLSIPASSANIGPGFDSAGIALSRYLTLEVMEQEKWEFKQRSLLLPSCTDYKEQFIYQIADRISKQHHKSLPSCKVIMDSEIPLARGLGSSASAVIAGVELANQLCDLSLSPEEKLKYSTAIEGHPDNVAPVLFGGLVISVQTQDEKIEHVQLPVLDLDVVVYIPTTELKTEDSRRVLPATLSRKEATTASGISNLMIASLLTGNFNLAGEMMERDLFHEPYRAGLIPDYHDIKREAKKLGAFGTVISGAGPTMISFVSKGKGNEISNQMKKRLPHYQVETLNIDQNGLQVKQGSHSITKAAE